VMIAAALAGKPDLLIADEPTSSLDVILQARIIQLIRNKQQQSGMSMLFISHDLPLVSTVADEILVLSKGEAVEKGSCHQVLTEPSHEFTAEMINAGIINLPWRSADAATT
jgi:peptide/nickel transport system ATP-binding protein